MKKLFIIFVSIFFIYPIYARAGVSAQSAVVVDARNGFTLYEKNADQKRSMASTTKIMTAFITLEAAALCDEIVEITQEMVAVEGSSMGLQVGHQLKLSDLAVGMLLASGNDAANSAAITLGTSTEQFSQIMNAKARQLGMQNTNFVTPSGLDSEEHYSTARDMATLARAAMQNEQFSSIASSSQLSVDFISPQFTAYYQNHNKLLRLYEGCIGVKTGFTKKSGRCLVSAAKRDGVTLIVVTLKAPDDWNDHIALFNSCFSKFENKEFEERVFSVDVVGAEKRSFAAKTKGTAIPLANGEEITFDIYLPDFLYAPVEYGEVIGKVVYKLDGIEIETQDIVANEQINELKFEKNETLITKIKNFFKKGIIK